MVCDQHWIRDGRHNRAKKSCFAKAPVIGSIFDGFVWARTYFKGLSYLYWRDDRNENKWQWRFAKIISFFILVHVTCIRKKTDHVQRKISVVLCTLLYLVHIFHLERGLFVFKKRDSMSSKFLGNFHLFNSLRPQYHDLNPFCKNLNYTLLIQEINFKLRLK